MALLPIYETPDPILRQISTPVEKVDDELRQLISNMFETMVEAIPDILKPRGRPRKRPGKLHADKGYDYPRCRAHLKRRRIIDRIARRGIESSTRLGRHRWVVERTLSWLNRFRRLKVRYERRADIHQAFLSLGCALICWNFVQRFC